MKSTGWALVEFRLGHCGPPDLAAPPWLILQRAHPALTLLHFCDGTSSTPPPCASPALATKPSPIEPRDHGAPAPGRVRRAHQRINSPGDKITAEVPKQGRGRLDAGPAPLQPLQSHTVAMAAPAVAQSPLAVVGCASPE